MALVNVTKLSKALNVTPRRVQQLVAEGLPKAKRGRYELGQCMLWYIRYLQKALEQRAVTQPDGSHITTHKERLRIMRADAEMKEINLAVRRGELVAIADVEKEMTDLVVTTKARILLVPARVAPELLGETSRVIVQAKIEKALKEALLHLADSR